MGYVYTDEMRADRKAYYETHREQILAGKRRHYRANRERLLRKQRDYAASHGDEIAAYRRNYASATRVKVRRFGDNLKLLKRAQGCDDCGTHEGSLVHHHLWWTVKVDAVSQMGLRSLESVLDEIAKCCVLCESCHKRRHHRLKSMATTLQTLLRSN